VLLWWVSGLNVLLVLDGHDRMTAALAEHTLPEVVVLAPAAELVRIEGIQQHQIRAYAGRGEHLRDLADRREPGAKARMAAVTRGFATQLGDLARFEGRTRAWPLAGGPAAWDRQAAVSAPGWNSGGG